MTRPRRGLAPFALVTIGALLLTGCSQERDDARLSRSVETSPSSTTASEDEVEASAAARVYQYVSGRSTIRKEPEKYTDVAAIDFAEGREATSLIAEAGTLAAKDRKQVGTGELTAEPTVLEVDLRPEKKQGHDVAPYVSVRACVDESDTHVVDAKGRKVADSEGAGPRPVEFHVLNRQWPSMSTWRIAWTKEIKGSC